MKKHIKRFCWGIKEYCLVKCEEIRIWYYDREISKTEKGVRNYDQIMIKRGYDFHARRNIWMNLGKFVIEKRNEYDKEFNNKTGLNIPRIK